MKNKTLKTLLENFGGCGRSTNEQLEILHNSSDLMMYSEEDKEDAIQYLEVEHCNDRLIDIARFCLDGFVESDAEFEECEEELDFIANESDYNDYQVDKALVKEAKQAIRVALKRIRRAL
jgi:hypothetical protein